MRKREAVESRFWRYVDKTGDCWLWTGGKVKDGYGQMSVDRRLVLVHRYSYALRVGPIPAGLHVLHSCDTPSCVNPAHLRTGTAKQNKLDAVHRGRHAAGENHGRAKFPAAIVRQARNSTGPLRETAQRLGMSLSTVSRIRRGELRIND